MRRSNKRDGPECDRICKSDRPERSDEIVRLDGGLDVASEGRSDGSNPSDVVSEGMLGRAARGTP